MRPCEIEHVLGRREPFGSQSLDAEIDALLGQRHFDIRCHARLLVLHRAARSLLCRSGLAHRDEQLAQRPDKREQFRRHHMALGQFDQTVRACFTEANDDPSTRTFRTQRNAATAFRRRKVRRGNRFSAQLLRGGGIGDPRLDEGRQALLIQLLELAAPATPEMRARRLDVVRSPFERSVRQQHVAGRGAPRKTATRGDAIPLGGDAQDFLGAEVRLGCGFVDVVVHRQAASAAGIACASCPAVKARRQCRAASP